MVILAPRPPYPRGKSPPCHSTRGWLGPRGCLNFSGELTDSCCCRPSKHHSSVVPPVPSHYTNWAMSTAVVLHICIVLTESCHVVLVVFTLLFALYPLTHVSNLLALWNARCSVELIWKQLVIARLVLVRAIKKRVCLVWISKFAANANLCAARQRQLLWQLCSAGSLDVAGRAEVTKC